ncbi:stearoyl-[acyl-carrier-protein] 9-desaturase, chloroplastic-like [Dioscorea cayenensis subsp. rotundata]|uniref:Stearoyl-[acyl-carrier-protein] 9-desaturase, chloroplastic-like n=1 Tax=Dioscorea cayennensis subsp. rotundata TaxID=55577 RepID=A0AB40BX55_DIOCR|nr:stearoyl-[acyl-carrier-protein] 9-desaturase, chloroplastic-like [Dioscorea cayenensis subsp. rotundata]
MRLAKVHGDVTFVKICETIAAYEKSHEMAYTKVVEKLFDVNSDVTMVLLVEIMTKRIVIPAVLLFDGQDEKLFSHYSVVAERIGVYTSKEFFVLRFIAGLPETGSSVVGVHLCNGLRVKDEEEERL